MRLLVLFLMGWTAFAQENSDTVDYEYRVKDYRGSYPAESERTYWDCWDEVAKMSIGCNFIRGDEIYNFRHVFRRVGGIEQQAQAQTCETIQAQHKKIREMNEKWNRDFDAADNTACASVPLDISFLVRVRFERTVLQQEIDNGCLVGYELDHEDDLAANNDRMIARRQKALREDREDCRTEDADAQKKESRSTDPQFNSSTTSSDSMADLFALGHNGSIPCFGCGGGSVGSRSSQSTITARQWGDTAGPVGHSRVRSAK